MLPNRDFVPNEINMMLARQLIAMALCDGCWRVTAAERGDVMLNATSKWSDALSRGFGEQAPELSKTLLQSLQDHKAGKKKLTASQLRTTRGMLRKLMAPAEIEEALDLVKVAPAAPSKRKKKPDHS